MPTINDITAKYERTAFGGNTTPPNRNFERFDKDLEKYMMLNVEYPTDKTCTVGIPSNQPDAKKVMREVALLAKNRGLKSWKPKKDATGWTITGSSR